MYVDLDPQEKKGVLRIPESYADLDGSGYATSGCQKYTVEYMKTTCEALYAQLFEQDAVTASSLFLVDKRVFQLQQNVLSDTEGALEFTISQELYFFEKLKYFDSTVLQDQKNIKPVRRPTIFLLEFVYIEKIQKDADYYISRILKIIIR